MWFQRLAESMVAGQRHGAGEVAKSYILTRERMREKRKRRERLSLVGAFET